MTVELVATDDQLHSACCPDPLVSSGVSHALRTISEAAFGPAGGWLHQVFDILNRRCWAGRLPATPLYFALTPHGKCLGLTHTGRDSAVSVVIINPGTLHPGAWNLGDRAGWRQAALVLLHEMLHVAQRRLYAGLPCPGETSHNQDLWVREANRISALIDLPPICTRFVMKRRGGTTLREPLNPSTYPVTQLAVAAWPHGIAALVHGRNVVAWQDEACRLLEIPEPGPHLDRCRV